MEDVLNKMEKFGEESSRHFPGREIYSEEEIIAQIELIKASQRSLRDPDTLQRTF